MLWVENSDSWIMAHEAGHLMGLEDKYRNQKQDDGAIISAPELGWEGNIMAQYNGIVDERNLAEIVE